MDGGHLQAAEGAMRSTARYFPAHRGTESVEGMGLAGCITSALTLTCDCAICCAQIWLAETFREAWTSLLPTPRPDL